MNFDAEDAPGASVRITRAFKIGGKQYTAEMPKQTPWLDAYELFCKMDESRAAKERLEASDAHAIPTPDKVRLERIRDEYPDTATIVTTFVTGWDDPKTGLPRGGFLRWSLTAEDYAELIRLPHDLEPRAGRSRVDWMDLFNVSVWLLLEFEPQMTELAEQNGLKLPDKPRRRPPKTAARKTAARK